MGVATRKNHRVSQSDIAREAGVSRVTVSLVLAGKDETTPETRRRVLEAAERLRYRPNLLVHGMQTGRTFCVGLILPPGTNVYLVQVAHGIHDELVQFEYVPTILWTHPDPQRKAGELQQIHRLVDRRVDGVILWPADVSVPDAHFHEIWERHIPLVTVDRETGTHADHVGTDEEHGGKMVAKHLLALGHRRVAVLGHFSGQGPPVQRGEAFAAAMEAAGAACRTVVPQQARDVPRVVEQLLRDPDKAPTALFAVNDILASKVYAPLIRQGRRIPQDMSLVGYADLPFVADFIPPLTTVRQDAYQIGRTAARLLLDRIMGRYTRAAPRREHLKPQLIVRGSTAPPGS